MIGEQRRALFWLGLLAAGAFVFWLLSPILLPFAVGAALAYILDPAVNKLERWGCARVVAVMLVLTACLAMLIAGLLILLPMIETQVSSLLRSLPQYVDQVVYEIKPLIQRAQREMDGQDLDLQGAGEYLGRMGEWLLAALGGIWSGGMFVVNLLSVLLITPIVLFFLLRDWKRIITRIDSWLPRDNAETIREQARQIDRTLSGFVRGQLSVCAILGAFYGITLTLMGLNFGLLIGITAGIIAFIPYLGTMVGFALSVGFALLQFDTWGPVALAAAIFTVGQVAESYFLTPKLVGDKVGLHPVWVIFSVLAGGMLFGFLGMLVAIPVAAVIGVLVRFSLSRYLDSPFYAGEGPSDARGPPP